VAQRTISALQTPTREGVAYKIDTRLRPSGNQGTLVSSLASFGHYHETSAALWERQALAKARVLTGPPLLRGRVTAAIERVVYGRGLTADEVAEMATMRARIADERGAEGDAVNIKTDWGGLVDVEFAVQMLQLKHGHADPRLRAPGTRPALDALIASGIVSKADGERLAAGTPSCDLEGRLRIERDQPVEAIDTDPDALSARGGSATRATTRRPSRACKRSSPPSHRDSRRACAHLRGRRDAVAPRRSFGLASPRMQKTDRIWLDGTLVPGTRLTSTC
jgi:glutamate-ammonia-ligase adenylyltransferase